MFIKIVCSTEKTVFIALDSIRKIETKKDSNSIRVSIHLKPPHEGTKFYNLKQEFKTEEEAIKWIEDNFEVLNKKTDSLPPPSPDKYSIEKKGL